MPHLGDFHVSPRVTALAALAVPVGAACALVAVVLLKLIALVTNLCFHASLSFSATTPGSTPHRWLIAVMPVTGGLAIGLMARYGSEKIRGHGMPEAIEAILVGGSKVQPRVAVLKPLSAAISIGSGGPFGAEGPIIMTGGAVGSILAQFLTVTADERKTLLVAGSAAGMAATFNSPLAAILLAVELLLFEWRPRSYIPVAAATVTATVVRGPLLGTGPLFGGSHVPAHLSLPVYPLCVVAGIVAGLLALAATALVYLSEDLFAKLPIHWMWWPAIGGAIIGAGGLIEPRALGVGYDVIGQLLTGRAGTGLIIGILVIKTLIWGLALGSGTSGGVLAPMFMIGGALGATEALVFPTVSPGFWALISLAGVLGGVMRSPLTGIVFCLELTHETNAILPMIITASTAYLLSVTWLKRSVLTEKIARRGLHLTREYSVDPLETHLVRDTEPQPTIALPETVGVAQALATVASAHGTTPEPPVRLFPVVDDAGRVRGAVTRGDLAAATGKELLRDLARPAITATGGETLRTVANRMAVHHVTSILILDAAGAADGVLTLRQLLAARRIDAHEEHHAERVMAIRLPRRTRTEPAG
ncbi:chloride channel protein [Catenulispora rubra]|uniref:chloride channel protein n=1 Tax=Catenulispora rubra TaxID=280293 RepID=UPI0034DD06E0